MHISVVDLEEEILNNLERRYLIYNTYAIQLFIRFYLQILNA